MLASFQRLALLAAAIGLGGCAVAPGPVYGPAPGGGYVYSEPLPSDAYGPAPAYYYEDPYYAPYPYAAPAIGALSVAIVDRDRPRKRRYARGHSHRHGARDHPRRGERAGRGDRSESRERRRENRQARREREEARARQRAAAASARKNEARREIVDLQREAERRGVTTAEMKRDGYPLWIPRRDGRRRN